MALHTRYIPKGQAEHLAQGRCSVTLGEETSEENKFGPEKKPCHSFALFLRARVALPSPFLYEDPLEDHDPLAVGTQKAPKVTGLRQPPHETLLNPYHMHCVNQECHRAERRILETFGSRGIFRLMSNLLDKDIKILPPEIQDYTQLGTVSGHPCKNSGGMVLAE